MNPDPASPTLLIRPSQIEPFDRGSGVVTIPYVGRWNSAVNSITTGITVFQPGTGIPLHTHNVEESVLILEGQATVTVGEEAFDMVAGDATWVPKDVPHRFINRGDGPVHIYWVYAGRHVTRTMCSTGKTVEHLSDDDRGAAKA
jgi:quercetin dioxygenase-like cupin family protein